MKCIKKDNGSNGNEIVRVTDDEAEKLVNNEDYVYVPKHVWKKSK